MQDHYHYPKERIRGDGQAKVVPSDVRAATGDGFSNAGELKNRSRGFSDAWNARNCERIKTKTDKKICYRFRRKKCFIKTEERLKHAKVKWSKQKIMFVCKKRQQRNRCVKRLLKNDGKRLHKLLRKRYTKRHYTPLQLKGAAKRICKQRIISKYRPDKQKQRLKVA